ncbi:MAG: hypothetical protein ACOY58_05530, partial [Candidatus Micrarchaeota archaeon]
QNQKGFDASKDTVLLRGVTTKDDFTNVLKEANSLSKQYGQVGEVSLFAHAGENQGPVFHDANGNATQFTSSELKGLTVNWEKKANAMFFGCNTGVHFAQDFANAQNVTSYGYEGYAYFSSDPNRQVGPHSRGSLYLIQRPGLANGDTVWHGVFDSLASKLGYGYAVPMVRKSPQGP